MSPYEEFLEFLLNIRKGRAFEEKKLSRINEKLLLLSEEDQEKARGFSALLLRVLRCRDERNSGVGPQN